MRRLPLASSHNTASSICGLVGQETRQTWTGGGTQTRLNDQLERPVASQLAQARLVLIRATNEAGASSLPQTAMHNSRLKRTNNALLFRASKDTVDIHADGHGNRTPTSPMSLKGSDTDAEATYDEVCSREIWVPTTK